MSAWFPVATALVGAAFGICAPGVFAYFTAERQATNEHRRWRRAELLNACVHFIETSSNIATIRFDPSTMQQTIYGTTQGFTDITTSFFRLQMIAPSDMQDLVKECYKNARELYDLVTTGTSATEQIMTGYVDTSNSLNRLMVKAQAVFK